jgi:hypothetical protein
MRRMGPCPVGAKPMGSLSRGSAAMISGARNRTGGGLLQRNRLSVRSTVSNTMMSGSTSSMKSCSKLFKRL